MSATNRGGIRKPLDLYETPAKCIENFLSKFKIPENSVILDPCIASGSIAKTVKLHNPTVKTFGIEIDNHHEDKLKESEISYLIKNFLDVTKEDILELTGKEKVDIIFTNPPYKIAQEFIEHSLQLADKVVMLLRLNFLESKKRAVFLSTHVPDIYVLSKRPSFTGGGTDATAYAWFVWDSNHLKNEGKVVILP